MRRYSSGVSVALIIALTLGAGVPQAQGTQGIAVSMDQMSGGQQVEFALNAGNIGKTATATANAQGTASSVFDFANQAKPQVEVDVYTFTCPTPPTPARVVVKMVEHGAPPPDDPCGNRKLLGAFWLHKTRGIVIHLTSGTMDVDEGTQILKWGLTAGGVVAVVGIIAAMRGGDSSTSTGTTPTTSSTASTTTTSSSSTTTTSSSSTSSTTSSTTTTTTTTAPSTNVSNFYGNFNIVATKTSDTGCNFNNSFTGQVQLSGNTDGSNLTARMIERLTRVYSGTMLQSGSFSATGSGNLDGFGYTGQISGQVSGNTITGNEVMNFNSGCPGKMVSYSFTGSR